MSGLLTSLTHRRLLFLAALVIALAAIANAYAYWTSSGSGSGSGNAGTLDAATGLSGTPGAGTVALSWNAVTPPAGGPSSVTYYLTRNGGSPGGDCPTSSSPANVLTCPDRGLSAGDYTYTVTAKWRSWTATSSSVLVHVASGALDHFLLAAATSTPSAGTADNLTITAKDSANNTVSLYNSSPSLTFSGATAIGAYNPTVTNSSGSPINFGSATTISFTNGVATVSGSNNGVMRLYKAGASSIVVSDGSHSNGAGLSITVSPLAINSLWIAAASTTPAAGAADNLTITALDSYGNTATS